MTTQSKALALEIAHKLTCGCCSLARPASTELRRQHAEIERLTAELETSKVRQEISGKNAQKFSDDALRLEAVNAGLVEELRYMLVLGAASNWDESNLVQARAAISKAEGA